MRFRCMRNECVGEPRIFEVLIRMDAFPKPTKTNGEKNCFRNIFLITIKSSLFLSYLNKFSYIPSFRQIFFLKNTISSKFNPSPVGYNSSSNTLTTKPS